MKPTRLPRTTDQIQGEYLLSVHGVMAKTQIGKSTLLALVAEGTFPQPKTISRQCVRWRGLDIDAWIKETFTAIDPVVQLRAVGRP